MKRSVDKLGSVKIYVNIDIFRKDLIIQFVNCLMNIVKDP